MHHSSSHYRLCKSAILQAVTTLLALSYKADPWYSPTPNSNPSITPTALLTTVLKNALHYSTTDPERHSATRHLFLTWKTLSHVFMVQLIKTFCSHYSFSNHSCSWDKNDAHTPVHFSIPQVSSDPQPNVTHFDFQSPKNAKFLNISEKLTNGQRKLWKTFRHLWRAIAQSHF